MSEEELTELRNAVFGDMKLLNAEQASELLLHAFGISRRVFFQINDLLPQVKIGNKKRYRADKFQEFFDNSTVIPWQDQATPSSKDKTPTGHSRGTTISRKASQGQLDLRQVLTQTTKS